MKSSPVIAPKDPFKKSMSAVSDNSVLDRDVVPPLGPLQGKASSLTSINSVNTVREHFKAQLGKYCNLEAHQKLSALSKARSKTSDELFQNKVDPYSLEYRMGLCRSNLLLHDKIEDNSFMQLPTISRLESDISGKALPLLRFRMEMNH